MRKYLPILILILLTLILPSVYSESIIQEKPPVKILTDTALYKYPTTQDTVYGALLQGSEVDVLSLHGEWAQVKYNALTGYVNRDCLMIDAASLDATVGLGLPGHTLFVGYDCQLQGYGTQESIELKQGAQVILLGVTDDQADVLYGVRSGTVPLRALCVDSDLFYPLGVEGDSMEELQTRLQALGYYDGVPTNVFNVETAEALLRFRTQMGLDEVFDMGDDFLNTIYEPDAPESLIRVANLTAGDTGNAVRRLQTRLKSKGYLETNVLGHYDSLTGQAVMLYQSIQRLPQTGTADPKTMAMLFSDDARTLPRNLMPATQETAQYLPGGTINSDWFEGDISEVFGYGVVAEITDLLTGLTWNEMRRGGSNHADVQPLTAEDTASMKAAVGGKWTWERRPIWVTVNGTRYAASMNCMPHGDGAITGNNYPGHHCIHFLNSMTHAGPNLDEEHQLCVSIAASADFITVDDIRARMLAQSESTAMPDED